MKYFFYGKANKLQKKISQSTLNIYKSDYFHHHRNIIDNKYGNNYNIHHDDNNDDDGNIYDIAYNNDDDDNNIYDIEYNNDDDDDIELEYDRIYKNDNISYHDIQEKDCYNELYKLDAISQFFDDTIYCYTKRSFDDKSY